MALQGGGAHGAFTWGVLDRILEDEEIEIAAISGTSAGALNGAALKAGMVIGGREGARKNLDWLWEQVIGQQDRRMTDWMRGLDFGMLARAFEYSPTFAAADIWSRVVSPYSYGPFYSNPLTPIVEKFDFDKVCQDEGPRAVPFVPHGCEQEKSGFFQGMTFRLTQFLLQPVCPHCFRLLR